MEAGNSLCSVCKTMQSSAYYFSLETYYFVKKYRIRLSDFHSYLQSE